MAYTFYNTPFNLNETSFVAGSHQEFIFAVYDSDGNPVSLGGASSKKWYLSPFGDPTSLVVVDGVAGSATNIVTFIVSGSSTVDLSGKYVMQVSYTDASGSTFKPSNGLVNIFRASI